MSSVGWIGKEERTYKNLESVQQWGGVGQAAKFKLGRVVLWYVSISASAEEDLLNAAEERVSQILDRVHHDAAVDGVTWRWIKTDRWGTSLCHSFDRLYCSYSE